MNVNETKHENSHCRALLKSAIVFHLRNEFDAAIEKYTECIRFDALRREASMYLGILLTQIGRSNEGSGLLTSLLLSPDLHERVTRNLEALRAPHDAKVRLESDQFETTHPPYPERLVGSVDDWRHLRMLEFCSVFRNDRDTWLTVGDHYGHDAQRLADIGMSNITVSSLTTEYLNLIKKFGGINNALALNAEQINLPDDSFDFVVCKEALHHMPRPYVAIYEMMRVARKAVIIVAEPTDPLIDWRPEGKNLTITRRFEIDPSVGPTVSFLGPSGDAILKRYIDWWETGPFNYVYTLSERELAKISQGYGIPSWATRMSGDYYNARYGDEAANESSAGFIETKNQTELQEILSSNTGIPCTRISATLFKQTPKSTIVSSLQSMAFKFNFTRTRYLPIAWPSDLDLGP